MSSTVGVVVVLAAAAAAPAQGAGTSALPIGFEPLGKSGQFGVRTPGGAASIAPGSAVLAGRNARPVRMRPLGARRTVRTHTGRRLPGVVNRLTGDRSQWRTGIPLYSSIRQRDVYRGIDLVFHTRKGALEYDFVVRPGASPRRIRLAVDGARRLRLSRRGDLLIRTGGGSLRHHRPVAYQRAGGRRVPVRARFVLRGKRRVAFRLGAYDRSKPLVIDPVVSSASYLGGSGYDESYDIGTDADGNSYVAGKTTSYDFPALAGADMRCGTDAEAACNPNPDDLDGRSDAFVAKLDSLGRLVWVTYIGGSSWDQADHLALDPAGRVVVAGLSTSKDFPLTAGAYRTTWPACDWECWSTYVLRLAPDGRSLDWSTLFTPDSFDTAIADIAVDPSGDVLLTGNTDSSSFPVTLGALDGAAPAMRDHSGVDGFVTRLDGSGARLDWSGVFGGEREDSPAAVAIAPGGDVMLAGRTSSKDFFVTPGAPQTRCDGVARSEYEGCDMDGFVMRVPANGATPTYSTYLGGFDYDEINALALDPDGRPLVAGTSSSTDFPATHSLTLSSYGRVFAARLPAAGGPPEWASFIAGGWSYVTGVASGSRGDVYVAGSTYGPDSVQPVSAYQSLHNGGLDGFVTRIASGGASARWATYLGGEGYDAVTGMAVGPRGVALSGTTQSNDFPTRGGSDAALGDGTCRHPYACPADAFVVRMTEGTTPAAYDSFARRRILQRPAGYAYADATSATGEAGEPAHAGQPPSHSVWFEWTAPANRTITFDSRDSDFDTVIAVYRGRSVSALTPVASNDDAPGRATSRVSFTAVRGRTYRIAVDGKGGATGLVRVEWDGAPPPNDDFLDAQPISGTSGSVTGSVVYATMETDEPPGGSYDDPVESIWYRWTAPSSGVYRLSTVGSDAPSEVEVFHGRRVELLEHLAWDVLDAKAGATYWLRVHPYNSSQIGDVKLSWRKLARPVNDDFARAFQITTAEGSTSGETFAATREVGEPTHYSSSSGAHTVWFRWAPPAAGTYELTVNRPEWDDELFLYEGSSLPTLKRLNAYSHSARLGFESGESVMVALDLFSEYRLSWRRVDTPANDLFSQAQTLAAAGGDELFATRGASVQLGEPSGYAGVWYRWTAPASGPVTFIVYDNSSWPDGLDVFTGSSVRALTPAGTRDSYQPKVTIDAVAGTTYMVRLGGGDGVRPLTWAFGRPSNDDFAAARALTGASGSVTFSTAHATTEAGEYGQPYDGTTWFAWTAPSSGVARFSTAAGRAGLPFDVFTGSQSTALTQVAYSSYDDDERGYIAGFDAVAGRTYRIRTRGAWLGTQRLTWNRAAGESDAPYIALGSYPAPGDRVRGTIQLTATPYDHHGVDRVDLLAGSTVVFSGAPNYYGGASGYWDTRSQADGPVTLTARAVDHYGNVGTSAPVDVVVDNTAPQTRILSGPAAGTSSRNAQFTFSAGEPALEWSCRLDRILWIPCAETLLITKLPDGPHALEVRSKDLAGNVDVTPARWAWTVAGTEAQPLAAAPPAVRGPSEPAAPATSGTAPVAGSTEPPAARSEIALAPDGRLQLSVALSGSRVTVARLRRGLRLAAGCSRACTLRARLQLLGRGKRTIAHAVARARSGRTATVRLRVSRRRAARLPARARLRLVVGAAAQGATAQGATASVRRPLVLRR